MLLSNDEIEVTCDALWTVKTWSVADDAQERLWNRLQPIRSGDYGGSATAELRREEVVAVVHALRACADEVELDADEQRLLERLTARWPTPQ